MKITVNKEVITTEEVEIETPAYYKNYLGQFYLLNDKGLIKISGGLVVIVPVTNFERDIDFKDVMSGKLERVTETEFNDAYVAFLERVNEITGMLTEI